MSIDAAFQRESYRLVVEDVRLHDASIKLRDAWVWKFGGDHWEFHYQDFYWHGSAGGAFDARSKGWCAYLRSKNAEGYREE